MIMIDFNLLFVLIKESKATYEQSDNSLNKSLKVN